MHRVGEPQAKPKFHHGGAETRRKPEKKNQERTTEDTKGHRGEPEPKLTAEGAEEREGAERRIK